MPSAPVWTQCPSCGMVTTDGPHSSSGECIAALEAEIKRLSELLERVTKVAQRTETKHK